MENKTSKPALSAGKYFKYAIGEIILVKAMEKDLLLKAINLSKLLKTDYQLYKKTKHTIFN